MGDYGEATYGDLIAGVYDDWYEGAFDEQATVALLKELAGAGPVLELGIGTGRVALALAAEGVEVHGIDASQAMVDRMRAKPGGDRISTTIGNFADVGVDRAFALVFVAFNTFFALTTQEEQVRCFKNVAGHLTTGGIFVIEAFVPNLNRFNGNQIAAVTKVDMDYVRLETSRHDSLDQRIVTQQIVIATTGVQLYPLQIRYAWPSELDLMAQLAGMRLRERWSGWRRDSFTAGSVSHVSVYERL